MIHTWCKRDITGGSSIPKLCPVRAVDLAEEHNFPQIEALLVRHTGQLMQKGDPLQAVEVFRLAGKATDAALLLAKLAEDAGEICYSTLYV